jgi:RNA polymerase sigma-70 factor (ECF subfamily)
VEQKSKTSEAIADDPGAAERLLLELLPRVRNLVRYLTRGDEAADDIAQEALVVVLEGLSTFRADGPFVAWLDRIVARATFRELRRRRVVATAPLDVEVASKEVGPEEYLARRQLVAILDRLPMEQRHALVLHHVLGMSVDEIAKELQVPAETVRSRLRLGKAHMRKDGFILGADAEES